MSAQLPPIDAHAHIQTSVSRADVDGLDACVFAVTRDPAEWPSALARNDAQTIWGVGVHPGVPAAAKAFDADAFAAALDRTLLIGEVGLDRRSKVERDKQRQIFQAVLRCAAAVPRPMSIHSSGASEDVLELLKRGDAVAPILHWWRGSEAQTRQAVELGCFFSVNGAEAADPKILDWLPRNRVLTETDFPHSKRSDPAASRPAATATIERELESRWEMHRAEVRAQVWKNLGALFERCNLLDRLPEAVQSNLLLAGLE